MRILLTTAACATLAVPCGATQIDLAWSEGVLGGSWSLDLGWPAPSGPQLYLFLPSLNAGPTPLALLDPSDPRLLEVGLDLFPSLAQAGSVVGTGTDFDLGLPNVPALAGATLHGQFVTLPGATTLVDGVSQPIRMRATQTGQTWLAPAEVVTARRHHTATVLDDGRVALLGGVDAAGGGVVAAELYDPQVQGFEPAGSGGPPRARHRSVLLDDGRVLMIGGVSPGGTVLASARIYDPIAGTTVAAAALGSPRVLHDALRLDDGRVLVVGGSSQFTAGDPLGFPAVFSGPLASAVEVYDPVADAWSSPASFPSGRTGLRATLQPDGTALITGGVTAAGTTTAETWVFDPLNDTLARGPGLPVPLALHAQVATADGGTLVAGGGSVSFGPASFSGSLASFTLGLGDPAWTQRPGLQQLTVCGALICIARPKDQQSSTPGNFVWTWNPPVDVVYFAGGGESSVDFTGGATTVTASTGYQRIFDGYPGWDVPATQIHARPGSRFVATDEGRRLLTTGLPAGAPGAQKTAELLTLP